MNFVEVINILRDMGKIKKKNYLRNFYLSKKHIYEFYKGCITKALCA